ncbi:toll/interleukin-1 receptor domain-containing protein [Arthrobacter gandavensis]|uniref:toll/interleukin-1 receptor domain-containing protein n=1 Tax=Arthrobacter gandavensis TaxID=169960 RepID=UPI00188ED04F|nr:toll/interleukin-1 receptor domain-containing protein [Arthrobacter gandavensis]MBF4993647.1 toll/interleukin-1 receptor domain-containing protein [Arthrobacter gandavensis]
MQVFISWSGKQSKHVALALRTWLPQLLDGKVTPFVSSEDIDKGDRGLNKIADELETSTYGILVVTPSNQNSPWINFEAGALGKSLNTSKVAPLLVGLTDSDVNGPIKQFQNSEASDREAVLSLIKSLNKAMKEPLGEGTVEVLFKEHWPKLEKVISAAPSDGSTEPTPKRGEADLLDEVLTTVRSLKRDVARMQKTFDRTAGTPPQNEDALFSDDEVTMKIMKALGTRSLSWDSDDSGFEVYLPGGSGSVSAATQTDLLTVALASGKRISLKRRDGSAMVFMPDGRSIIDS